MRGRRSLQWLLVTLLVGCDSTQPDAPFASGATPRRQTPDASAEDATTPTGDAGAKDATTPLRDAGADALPGATDGGTSVGTREICTESGIACLTIFEGALEADAAVTLRQVEGGRTDLEAWGFLIEPAGLTFEPNARLRIDVSTLAPPAPYLNFSMAGTTSDDRTAWRFRGWPDDDGWLVVPNVSSSGMSTLGWAAVGVRSGCPSTPSTFTACGGDLIGTWILEGFCYETVQTILYDNWNPERQCTAIYDRTAEWALEGELQVTTDTFTRTEATAIVPLRVHFDLGCSTFTGDCIDFAAEIGEGAFTCTGDLTCDCEYAPPVSTPELQASYTTSASALSLNGGPPMPYCARDGMLHIVENDHVVVYRKSQ